MTISKPKTVLSNKSFPPPWEGTTSLHTLVSDFRTKSLISSPLLDKSWGHEAIRGKVSSSSSSSLCAAGVTAHAPNWVKSVKFSNRRELCLRWMSSVYKNSPIVVELSYPGKVWSWACWEPNFRWKVVLHREPSNFLVVRIMLWTRSPEYELVMVPQNFPGSASSK